MFYVTWICTILLRVYEGTSAKRDRDRNHDHGHGHDWMWIFVCEYGKKNMSNLVLNDLPTEKKNPKKENVEEHIFLNCSLFTSKLRVYLENEIKKTYWTACNRPMEFYYSFPYDAICERYSIIDNFDHLLAKIKERKTKAI